MKKFIKTIKQSNRNSILFNLFSTTLFLSYIWFSITYVDKDEVSSTAIIVGIFVLLTAPAVLSPVFHLFLKATKRTKSTIGHAFRLASMTQAFLLLSICVLGVLVDIDETLNPEELLEEAEQGSADN